MEIPDKKPLVLVIDDEPDFCDLVKVWLETQGYPVLTAPDTIQGLDALEKNPSIGLIVSDVAMPGESGTAFLSKVRKNYAGIPFILMSGHLEFETGVAAVLGADGALSKPFTGRSLVEAVQHALKSASAD
jgi:DNA-binding NtrC family response regulator